VHANIVSGLLDGRLYGVPDYAAGYESIALIIAGLVLAFGLSLGTVQRAVAIAVLTVAAVIGINSLLFMQARLVLPVGATLAMIGATFALNMSWGYLVEARASRRLAKLFGTYVPRELVAEMQADPGRYSCAPRAGSSP
jgi:adenylate cyclase